LIGFPGSGKSTVGRKVAQERKVPFFDTDHLLEKRYHLHVRNVWYLLGEKEFRLQEKACVLALQPGVQVIATGGGVGLCEESSAHLRRLGEVIYLKVRFSVVYERLQKRGLPAWARGVTMETVFEERSLLYERHATQVIDYE